MPPLRDELLSLCYQLRNEKLTITSEFEQVILLNNDVNEAIVNLVKACWIHAHQQELLGRLIRGHGDGPLETCCAQLASYEQANFRHVSAVLPAYGSTLTEVFRLLLNNSRLVANVLHLVDLAEPAASEDACRLFFCIVYGCCQFVGDEKCLVETLSALLRLLLVTGNATDWRRTLRKGRGAACKLYRIMVENLFSVKLFLTSALHEPILKLISEYELLLDMDPAKAAMRLSACDKFTGWNSVAESSTQCKESAGKYRKKIIQHLVAITQRFVKSIKASLHCFPAPLSWLLQQLHAMLRLSAKMPPSECDLLCTELVFTYLICPAVATPEAFGILGDVFVSSVARFNLMQVGQILQTLAISQWEMVDPKQADLYQHLDGAALPNAVYSIINGCSSESSATGLDEVYRGQDNRPARHLSAMTLEEVEKLFNLIRGVVDAAQPPQEVEGAWNELKQSLATVPPLLCNAMQQQPPPNVSADETGQSKGRSYMRFPKSISISLVKSPSESDSSGSAPPQDVPTVLLVPVSTGPEMLGMMDEEKVLSMAERDKYRRDENTVKRTRFLLNADSESMGASSDHFDEAASEASVSSSAEHITNPDMSTLNDNFSDVDVVPMSANVSCRGSPSCSGRDTPSSSVPADCNDNAFEVSSQSTSGNSTRPMIGGSASLAIPAIKEAAMEERFGKFGIPRPSREATHSMVSDSWSTDVLASDSEMGSDAQPVVTGGALPDIVPCQLPNVARFDLVPIRGGCASTAKVAPSDQSSVCDRSDTWSVDAVTSDSENEPTTRAGDDCAQDFEGDVFPSTSGHRYPTGPGRPDEGEQMDSTVGGHGHGGGGGGSSVWESCGRKARQRHSSGSSLHSEVPDDVLMSSTYAPDSGGGWKEKNGLCRVVTNDGGASSVSLRVTSDDRDELSMAYAGGALPPPAGARNLRSTNFGSAMAKRLSPHVSRVLNVKVSLSPPYESAFFKGLKLRSSRGKTALRPTTSGHCNVVAAVSSVDEVAELESGDQILEKYRTMQSTAAAAAAAAAAAQQHMGGGGGNASVAESSTMVDGGESVTPYFDGSNVTRCQAFADAKRKLRHVLSIIDVDAMPILAPRTGLGKEPKECDELAQILRALLAETVITDERALSVQVQDLLRLVTLFDGKTVSKLLKTLHEEQCRRNEYIAYLQQSKLSLLQARSLLQRLLLRLGREQRLTIRSALDLCVRLFAEQRCEGQLKSFVLQFQQLQTQDEKTDLLELFLRTIYSCIESEAMFQGCTSQQLSHVQLCLERLVMARIYVSALYPNGEADMMRDKLLRDMVERLGQMINPGHRSLNIPSMYHAECPWPCAQAELCLLNVQKTPRDKVNCVRRCCDTLLHLLRLSSPTSAPSADDLVPVLVYVIIKANPEALLSTIQYVNGFYGSRLQGEDAYWWTLFCSAVEFIKVLADVGS